VFLVVWAPASAPAAQRSDDVVLRIQAKGLAQAIPSDPLWQRQQGLAQIGAPKAWAVTMGSPRVVIAVLDTGVDFSQPDLQGALVPGFDVLNGTDDPSDDNGHGTRTAGIVGARGDNGLGISGVCPRCSIMPVKVVGADGTATGFDVASGITWATTHGAAVISLSLGGAQSNAIAGAIEYAESKGVLIVAAAGNGGSSEPFYPAADPGVLSVAATQTNGQLYPWSNHGSWVSVGAPGCDTTTFNGGGFGKFCGTSASAPVVAGLAGLALSYSPTSSAATIEQAIVSSAHHIDGVSGGRVDAAGTLAALGAKLGTPAMQALQLPSRASGARTDARTQSELRTHVKRRALRLRWHLRLAVEGGRVAATLRSPKAPSCSLRLQSAQGVMRWSRHNKQADVLVAKVRSGRYRLLVSCKVRRPRPASLTVRAHFRKAGQGAHHLVGRIESRGLPVRLANFLDRS
jgi:subtilisin family serine protease